MEINRQTVQLLRPQLDAALQALAKEHNLKITVGNCSYDPSGRATYKLEVAAIREDGTALTKEAAHFLQIVGFTKPFQKTDLNRTFVFQGIEYRLTGAKPRGGKKPFVGVRVKDGQLFQFGEELVAVCMYGREAYANRYKSENADRRADAAEAASYR